LLGAAFCRLEIDHKLELGRLDNREIGRISRGAAAMGIITIRHPPIQTPGLIGNVITELPAGRAVVLPINGRVGAIGRRVLKSRHLCHFS
jgi:hypothetical protein